MTNIESRPRNFLGNVKEIMWTFPLYILSSPFKGFDDMKFLKKGDMRYSIAILIIGALVRINIQTNLGFVASGYHNPVPNTNVPLVIMMFLAPIILFTFANWSATTITDGKGSIREIFQTYTYALFPSLVCTIIALLLSHVVTLNEGFFVVFFITMGNVLLYGYLFVGLIVIHEYSFLKAVIMVVLTILAMLIITFVLALFMSLLSNFMFFTYIIREELRPHLGF